jgi:hypothetical protein
MQSKMAGVRPSLLLSLRNPLDNQTPAIFTPTSNVSWHLVAAALLLPYFTFSTATSLPRASAVKMPSAAKAAQTSRAACKLLTNVCCSPLILIAGRLCPKKTLGKGKCKNRAWSRTITNYLNPLFREARKYTT